MKGAVLCALTAAVSFGCAGFVLGRTLDGQGARAAFTSIYFTFLGYGLTCACVTSGGFHFLTTVKTDVWAGSSLGSRYVNVVVAVGRDIVREVKRIGWKYTGLMVASGLINAGGTLTLTLAIEADGDSKGAVLAIASFAGVVVSLVSWVVWRETLNWTQWAFLGLATVGIVVLSLAAQAKGEISSIVFAFATLLCFAGANLVVKIVVLGRDVHGVVINVYYELTHLVLGVVAVVVMAGLDEVATDLEPRSVGLALLTGVLLSGGVFFINLGISLGHAGVVTAIGQGGTILTVALDLIVGVYPTWLQVVGIVLALLGIAGLSLASSSLPPQDDTHGKWETSSYDYVFHGTSASSASSSTTTTTTTSSSMMDDEMTSTDTTCS